LEAVIFGAFLDKKIDKEAERKDTMGDDYGKKAA
jgi:hypothetical protein